MQFKVSRGRVMTCTLYVCVRVCVWVWVWVRQKRANELLGKVTDGVVQDKETLYMRTRSSQYRIEGIIVAALRIL
jgi:hypothetical protein